MNEINNFNKKQNVSKSNGNEKKIDENITQKKDSMDIIEISSKVINGTLYEHCYDGNSHFFLYKNKKGKICSTDSIIDGKTKYIPFKDELVEKDVILLPDGISKYQDKDELIEEILDFINKYWEVDYTDRLMCAYYILFSYVYDRFLTCPFLRVSGFFESGKSRFLDTIGKLCYKPMIMCGISTPASISRIIDKYRGTLVVDEISENNKMWHEMNTIFLLRFEANKPLTKCRKDDPSIIYGFYTYGCSVLATYETFKNLGLESRCYTISASGKDRVDIPIILPDKFKDERMDLVRKLLKYRLDNFDKKFQPRYDKLERFNDRTKQILAPIFSLVTPKYESAFLDVVKKHELYMIEQKQVTYEGQVVTAIQKLLGNNTKKIMPKAIATCLKVNGYEISARKVGEILKSLGFQTKRFSGGSYIKFNPTHWKRTCKKFGLK
jgi:hypothetical protein